MQVIKIVVFLCLGIIENITEFKPELCIEVAKQGFLQWILKRLKVCTVFVIHLMNVLLLLTLFYGCNNGFNLFIDENTF